MQLNWLYFCGIYQMMPLKVWPNTALGCNHQSILLWYPMYYPGGMKARVSPVQWSKPYSILAPLRIRTQVAGFKIISGDHYTTTAHSGSVVVIVGNRPDVVRTITDDIMTLSRLCHDNVTTMSRRCYKQLYINQNKNKPCFLFWFK